jgi:hypothetical protein
MSLMVKALILCGALNLLPILGLLWLLGTFDDPPINCTSFRPQRQAQAFYEQYGAEAFDIPPDVIDYDDYGQICENRPRGAVIGSGVDARQFLIARDDGRGVIYLFLGAGALSTLIFSPLIAAWLEVQSDKDESSDRSSRRPTGRPSYHTYLRSEAWSAKRQAAIRRAGGRCQLCNRSGPLEVHHRTYERLGHERDDDLIVLCRSCHQAFHDHRGMPISH